MKNMLSNENLGKLFIRLAVGIVFVVAGWMKISNIDMIVGFFDQIGLPSLVAYLVGYIEFLGGIAIILGLCVRCAGVALAIIMLSALFLVHIENGYSLANNGYEYVLMLLLSSLAIASLGAGKYSVSAFFKK